jgi:hypothetical protein
MLFRIFGQTDFSGGKPMIQETLYAETAKALR